MKHLQIIGCVLILITTVLFFADQPGIAGITLLAVGVVEGILIYKKKQTITQWYIPKLSKKFDMPISIGVPVGIIIKLCFAAVAEGKATLIGMVIVGCILIWIYSHLCSLENVK